MKTKQTRNTLVEYISLFPEPVIIVNIRGEVLAINNGATLFWQRNAQELLGQSLAELLQQSTAVVQQWLNLCQGSSQMLAAHFSIPEPATRQGAASQGFDWIIEGVGLSFEDEPAILARMLPSFCHNQEQLTLTVRLTQLQMELTRQAEEVAKLRQRQQILEQEKEHLQILAERDSLTGLANRYFFDRALNSLWEEAQVQNYALILALIDIDDFKAYNDCYGHLAGDRALQQVAQTLKTNLRSNDIVARYGGEEFALVLPHVAPEAALHIVERMLTRVRELRIPQAETAHHPYLTVSGGLCFVPAKECQGTITEIVAVADAALYQAKQQGRDRCVLLQWPQDISAEA